MLDELWVQNALNGRYLATDAVRGTFEMNWAIDGWLPEKGPTVWFGPGGTGKTQLQLWMAVCIAANGMGGPATWLGGAIGIRGHILVLTAEDTRDHVLMRLGTIVRTVVDTPEAQEAVCSRIHLMPFLSLGEEEFKERNPSLFSKTAKGWEPNSTIAGIRFFIQEHNKRAVEQDGPDSDNRIVGVIMDSSTSMAGFEANDSDGATSLLFYIARACQSLGVFWSVIGHTQKIPNIDPDDPRANAVARLRGSAMWSTAPRIVVEVRLACNEKPKKQQREPESYAVRRTRPEVEPRDIVVVDVAKANVPGTHEQPRFLIRREDGMFEDFTQTAVREDHFARNDAPLTGEQDVEEEVSTSPKPAPAGDARRVAVELAAVLELVRHITGGEVGAKVTRSACDKRLKEVRHELPGLANVATSRTTGNGDKSPRIGTTGWYLERLAEQGVLRHRGVADFTVVDIGATAGKPEADPIIPPEAGDEIDLAA